MLFIVIVFGILGLQILLISFTSTAFHVYKNGLSVEQWGMSFALGLLSIPVNFGLKFVSCEKSDKERVEDLEQSEARLDSFAAENSVKESREEQMSTGSHMIKVREKE